MSDAGEIAKAVGSVTDLASQILNRADRDGPTKELNEHTIKIQNAFAENSIDSDSFRIFADELCNKAGHSLTPTGDPKFGRRELFHALLLIAAEHAYAKQILARLLAERVKD